MHGAATQCVSALGARLVRGDTFKKDVCTEGEGGVRELADFADEHY